MRFERIGDLQIDQDIAFQRRSWAVQRAGWVVMVVLMAGAAIGLFGSGPLSHGSTVVPGLFRVDFQRFSRYQTPETLTISLEPAATQAGRVRLGIDRRFLDGSKIDTVLPPPTRVDGRGDRLVYEFTLARPGEPLTIAMALEPEHLGVSTGRVSLESDGSDEPPRAVATFRQLVYP